jgi:polar amino acid transport system substrate-binding protein
MRRLVVASLVLLGVALAGCGTFGVGSGAPHSASPVTDRILARGEIRIGMTGSQPPFSMRNRDGALFGMDVDLAEGLARTMGVELKIVTMPFAKLLPALVAGEVDAVFSGMTMTGERNLEVAFAGPYFVSGKAALSKSESLASADDPSEINGPVRMAVLAGSTSESFARRELPEVELVSVADYDAGIRMVLDDSVDAMIADYPATIVALFQHPDADLASTVSTFSFEPIGVAIAPEGHLMTNVVQNYVLLLEGTGTLERLRAAWFDDGAWIADLARPDGE